MTGYQVRLRKANQNHRPEYYAWDSKLSEHVSEHWQEIQHNRLDFAQSIMYSEYIVCVDSQQNAIN